MGGIEAVYICTSRQLRDLNGGHTEESVGEVGLGAPGLAAIGGTLIVVVGDLQGLALDRGKDLAGLQVVQQVSHTGLDLVAGLSGIALLTGGDGHSGSGALALGGHGLGRGLLAVGGSLFAALVLTGGLGLVGSGGLLLASFGNDSSIIGDLFGERRHGHVAHQGQHHGQRQQK